MEMASHLSPSVKQLCFDLNQNQTPSTPMAMTTLQISTPDPDLRLRLVQLLLVCAAHTASSDVRCINACLRRIATLSSPSGDYMQRVAARLAASSVHHQWPAILSTLRHHSPSSDVYKAQLAFARTLPYLPFAHAAIGRALLRALEHEPVVHLVDLGASHTSIHLWVPVLRVLSRDPRGLTFTCVSPDPTVLSSLGSALAQECDTLNVIFRFNPVHSSLRQLEPAAIRARAGEALAVVSVLSLHELLAGGEMDVFLATLQSMLPKVVVVAEQEADNSSERMVERFSKAVHYYSVVFKSVESAADGELMTRDERMVVEEMLGGEMESVVGCEGTEMVERHERAERWVERMVVAGFELERMWNVEACEEGTTVVGSWPGEQSYSVAIHGGCVMICWHDCPLYSVSAWQCS